MVMPMGLVMANEIGCGVANPNRWCFGCAWFQQGARPLQPLRGRREEGCNVKTHNIYKIRH
jgi:hypothetical protein